LNRRCRRRLRQLTWAVLADPVVKAQRVRTTARAALRRNVNRRFLRLVAVSLATSLSACDGPSGPDPVGTLELSVTGLPDTIDAEITVGGPNGYSTRVVGSRTLTTLAPGSYTITASQVVTGVATFVPAFQSLPVTIGAGSVSKATVIYSVTTGSISVIVAGVPAGIPWTVMVTGPSGYRDSVSANTTLGNLAPGSYAVSAGELRKGPDIYAPKPAEFVVIVPASVTSVPAVIGYTLVTGSLALHVNGLPAGVSAQVAVTGPNGFAASAAGSVTLEGLLLGRYDVAASPVGSGAGQHAPSPASQSVTIVPGATALVSVNYWPGTLPGLNLAVEAVQVQQVVQTYGGAVPSIAGRDALLRVFVRASEPNTAAPVVRVRLYDGAELVATSSIPAPAAGVPTTIDEGQLAGSWNLPIDGSLMRPGLRVLADVDPDNAVVETVESDNAWPSSGTPLALDVRNVASLAVRLVPVTQTATGLTGNVTPANAHEYFEAARKLLPVGVLTMDVRVPYTSNAPALQPNDANGAWVQILSELNALRAAEGTTAHYYGVVRATYSSGVAGLSYLPSVVAVGWDTLPHAAATMVHELGHNFGRLHSNSCGAGGYDANYPYANGAIGVYGYDALSGTLRDPSTPDIMGYCNDRWISDYTYTGILGFRATQSMVLASFEGGHQARPGLLVWGRIAAAGLVLEPAFEVNAPAKLPASGGPHRVEVLDESGRVLVGLSFRGDRTVDAPGGEDEHFAFVIPLEALAGVEPARLRVLAAGRRAELAAVQRLSRDQLAADFTPAFQRISPTRVRVLWRHSPGRGVLVRDAQTGAILSFGRGGQAEVEVGGERLDLTLSDGVRSAQRSIVIR